MNLLYIALACLVISLVSAGLGYGGVADTAMEGARIFAWTFLALFIVTIVANLWRRGQSGAGERQL